jgi:hypothetical protein
MGVIKSVLKEELENSLRMKEEYEKALKANPGGLLTSFLPLWSYCSIGFLPDFFFVI